MASATAGTAGSGRRRSLDAEVNLVPFIDLLSMCICFLLVTAVWIQIGAVQVKQARGTEAAPSAADQLELSARFLGPGSIEFSLRKQGKTFRKEKIEASDPASLNAKLDQRLTSLGNVPVSAAMIYPRDGVPYGDLVLLMDTLRKHQIVNLGVVPAPAR